MPSCVQIVVSPKLACNMGGGPRAMRILAKMDSAASMQSDSSVSDSSKPSQTTPSATAAPSGELVWPLAAKRGCYELRRASLQLESTQSDPVPLSDNVVQAATTTEPRPIGPLAAKSHIRRMKKAESAGVHKMPFSPAMQRFCTCPVLSAGTAFFWCLLSNVAYAHHHSMAQHPQLSLLLCIHEGTVEHRLTPDLAYLGRGKVITVNGLTTKPSVQTSVEAPTSADAQSTGCRGIQ